MPRIVVDAERHAGEVELVFAVRRERHARRPSRRACPEAGLRHEPLCLPSPSGAAEYERSMVAAPPRLLPGPLRIGRRRCTGRGRRARPGARRRRCRSRRRHRPAAAARRDRCRVQKVAHRVGVFLAVEPVQATRPGSGVWAAAVVEIGFEPADEGVRLGLVRPRRAGRRHHPPRSLRIAFSQTSACWRHVSGVIASNAITAREQSLVVAGDAIGLQQLPVRRAFVRARSNGAAASILVGIQRIAPASARHRRPKSRTRAQRSLKRMA